MHRRDVRAERVFTARVVNLPRGADAHDHRKLHHVSRGRPSVRGRPDATPTDRLRLATRPRYRSSSITTLATAHSGGHPSPLGRTVW